MVQQYPYSTRWEQNIVKIIHINGSRAIFLLFCNHHENEYEPQEMEIGVSGPIFIHKISKALLENFIDTRKMGGKHFGNYSYLLSLSHFPKIL